jgi:hypothetical protein
MSGGTRYEHLFLSLAAMRPLSRISDISQPEQQNSFSTSRESVSPLMTPAIPDNNLSHPPANEKDRLRISSASISSSRTAIPDSGTLPLNAYRLLLIVVSRCTMASNHLAMVCGLDPNNTCIDCWTRHHAALLVLAQEQWPKSYHVGYVRLEIHTNPHCCHLYTAYDDSIR